MWKAVLAFASVFLLNSPCEAKNRNTRKPLPSCGTAQSHNACDPVILNTPEFMVRWGRMTGDNGRFSTAGACSYKNEFLDAPIHVNLALVFKTTDPNFAVRVDDEYRKRFETQILPAIEKQGCTGKPFARVFVAHYLETVMISDRSGPIYTDPPNNYPNNTPPGIYVNGEVPLSSLTIEFEKKRPKYGEIQSRLGAAPATLAGMMELHRRAEKAELVDRELRARAEDQAAKRSMQNLSEGLRHLGKLLEPAITTVDRLHDYTLDPSKVFYVSDRQGDASSPSLTLCNHGESPVRVASLIQSASRMRNFDPNLPTWFMLRGWGHLAPSECRSLNVGVANAAILRLERETAPGKFTPIFYETSGGVETANQHVRTNRMLSIDGVSLCIPSSGLFEYEPKSIEAARQCTAGQVKVSFPYVMQRADDKRYVLDLE